ncbi:MAG: hypothetical protein CVV19_17860 [Gammaproteobacteria bacterium HGW-Gammaproteobacteria-9]|nr:MAG: hypothetical protein CVV19_17860 [Gammaproteobacteria bacterium HGW-Gammaproteobacteria-9]
MKSIFPIPAQRTCIAAQAAFKAGRVIHKVLAPRHRQSILVGVATSSVHQWVLARVTATLAAFP